MYCWTQCEHGCLQLSAVSLCWKLVLTFLRQQCLGRVSLGTHLTSVPIPVTCPHPSLSGMLTASSSLHPTLGLCETTSFAFHSMYEWDRSRPCTSVLGYFNIAQWSLAPPSRHKSCLILYYRWPNWEKKDERSEGLALSQVTAKEQTRSGLALTEQKLILATHMLLSTQQK